MVLLATLLTCTMFWKLSSSLKCYACEAGNKVIAPACDHFEYTDRYMKDCYNSTMCFKRVTTMEFSNGYEKTETIEKGCAMQTLDQDQEKVNGHWQYVSRVYEVYKEGCFEDPNNSERSTKILHCYCRGDYCNGAGAPRIVLELFVLTVLALFVR